jgi:DNA polymerase-3 subunit epsilon
MYLLADALGLSDLADEMSTVISACTEPQPAPEARYLQGLRVGIVGGDEEIVALRKRAESYGAKLAVNITKTVVWIATTTPDSTDAKHSSARKLGIPMLAAAQASDRLVEAIREAELKAYERQREIDESIARRQQYQAEREAYWRPTWRQIELDHDPEPEYDWY